MPASNAQPRLRHTTLTDIPVFDVLHLAASERGLIAITYNISTGQFLMQLAAAHHHVPLSGTDVLADARAQLREYLHGARTQFSMRLDLSSLTGFQYEVLSAVASVPYGQTRAYGEIAAQIGRPHAARAVGGSNARNPLPLVIPCHRVIAADGSLGGYSGLGGLRTKRRLLALERVRC